MKKICTQQHVTFFTLSLLLLLLPACDWFKQCTSGSCSSSQTMDNNISPELQKEVVISFAGRPVVTGADLEKSIQMLMQAQPAFQQMWPFMGAEQQMQVLKQIAENLAAERIMHEYVKRSGLDKTAEFKENARQIHDAVDRDLAMRAFQNELVKNIVISDEEAQKYYETHRDKPNFKRPPFVAGGSGIQTEVIVASSVKEAQDIAAQAKKNSNFEAVAKSFNKKVMNLGTVAQQSMNVDTAIKTKLMGVKRFPSIEVVKGSDKKDYVVKAISKKDEQFADFSKPEVKEAVKEMLLGERFSDIFNKKMADLKAEYNVVINNDHITKRMKSNEPQSAEQPAEDVAQIAPKAA